MCSWISFLPMFKSHSSLIQTPSLLRQTWDKQGIMVVGLCVWEAVWWWKVKNCFFVFVTLGFSQFLTLCHFLAVRLKRSSLALVS
jgi:hypothetical protein